MSRQVSGKTSLTYIADPKTAFVFGSADPFPVEIAEQTLSVTVSGLAFNENNLRTTSVGLNSNINFIGDVSALSTYTSSSELVDEPDVGSFTNSTNNGILRYQFSPDNTNWSSFPVNGFTMASNIWEFHTAVKLPRWFRYQFDNCGDTDCSLTAYVYYGHQFRQGSLPLNQTINNDNDAMVTRSVGIGQEPDGTYANMKKDGTAFITTGNLQGTTLQTTLTTDTSGAISLADTSGFSSSGYIYIGTEVLRYDSVLDNSQINIPLSGRAAYGSTASSHSIGDTVGEVYDSGIIDIRGYTEVATRITCSNNAQMIFLYYSDADGSDLIHRISPPYASVTGYDYLSAPNFGPYTRALVANKESTATTDLFYDIELYTKAVSAQVLTLNSTLLGPMTANVTRSVQVGQQPDGDFVNAPADGNVFSTSDTLLADASYTSSWIDTDGYNLIELFVRSDVSSAEGGIKVQFSDNVQTDPPIIQYTRQYTYSNTDVNEGYKSITIPTTLDGYRLNYINGSADQTTFFLETTLKTNGIAETTKLNSALTDDKESTIVRAVQVGKDPLDSYVNTRQDGYVIYVDGSSNLPYTSELLDTEGYTQIQTDIMCDVSGTINGLWYDNLEQDNVLRTFSVPYNSDNCLESFSAPTLAKYITLGFTADGSADTFHLATKLTTKSLSGQVLSVTSNVVNGMVANLGRNVLVGQDKAENFKNVPIDATGNLKVNISNPITAFGQIKVSEETPIIEQYFPYGIMSDEVNTYALTASVGTTGGSGTGLSVDYTASGGALTTVYPTNNQIGSGYALNDNITVTGGTSGVATVRSITGTGGVLSLDISTVGSGYSAPNSSITYNEGLVQLTASGESSKAVMNTRRLCKYHTGTGVISRFTAIHDPSLGSFEFVGVGDENNGFFLGCMDGSFCILRRRNSVDTVTYQNQFNIDTLDGSRSINNPSGFNLDITKGNVYQIKYQWLGFGIIIFSVENNNEGELEIFHRIQYSNNNTEVSILNPSLPFRWEVANITNTGQTTLKTASAMAAVEGKRLYPNKLYSATADETNLTIRNRRYFNNIKNRTEIFLNSITLVNNATNGGKTFTITKNPATITGVTYSNVSSISVVESSSNTATISGGTIIGIYTIDKLQSENIKFDKYEVILVPEDVLYISVSGTADTQVVLTWFEDK